ncbi:hypothetical protein ACTXT7_017216, partial [Hymenolepis weldensis]
NLLTQKKLLIERIWGTYTVVFIFSSLKLACWIVVMSNLRSQILNFIDASLTDCSLISKEKALHQFTRNATPEYGLSVGGGPELQNFQLRDISFPSNYSTHFWFRVEGNPRQFQLCGFAVQ